MRIQIQKYELITTPQSKTLKLQPQNPTLSPLSLSSLSSTPNDPNFPQSPSSIGTNLRPDLPLAWLHIDSFAPTDQLSYSQHITDLNTPQYVNRAITECLLIMNWFVGEIFAGLFSQRVVSRLRVYQFVVCCWGVLKRLWVDSRVPVLGGRVLFAEAVGGSVFGAIFEKMIAKVYGSYEAISDNLIDLLQLWTAYPVQHLSPHRHSPPELLSFIQQSHKKQSLVFFRTRNSIKLQASGMPSNSIYIIVRAFEIREGEGTVWVLEFLELAGERWRGKYSRGSGFWEGQGKLVKQHKVSLTGIENYISLPDLLGISRQLSILHNSQSHSHNWHTSPNPTQKHSYQLTLTGTPNPTHTMLSINFLSLECYNLAYLICQDECELLAASFVEGRSRNFMGAFLEPGKKYVLGVYGEIGGLGLAVNVGVYTEHGWCEIEEISRPIFVEETSFLHFFNQLPAVQTLLPPDKTSKISTKCLYKQLGLGALIITLEPTFPSTLHLHLNLPLLAEHGLQLLNKNSPQLTYSPPCQSILLFRFKNKNKFVEGDAFPPRGSVTLWVDGMDGQGMGVEY